MRFEAIFNFKGKEMKIILMGHLNSVLAAAKRLGSRPGYALVLVRKLSNDKVVAE